MMEKLWVFFKHFPIALLFFFFLSGVLFSLLFVFDVVASSIYLFFYFLFPPYSYCSCRS